MRTFLAVALIISLAIPQTYAATENIGQGMGDKALRGAVNILTGIIELPMQTYKGFNAGHKNIESKGWSKTVGAILGFFRGISHTIGRVGWGAMELFGFWSANHPDNEGVGIPFDAQYPWEMGTRYSVFEPNFQEGIKPVAEKIGRGLADAVAGILEIPGQTFNQSFEGNMLGGLGRGFWFFFSRELYGIGSIFTFFAPNPTDNPGYSFDGKWPWSALAGEVE